MKKIIFFIAGILMSLLSSAQDEKELGKYVGDLPIQSALFYPGTVRSLSDLKGKVVLLDFWSSRCLSCFHSFPKVSALQSKFNGDVVHFYVTTQPRKEVEDFFARRPEFLKYKLRFITDADKIAERFPHLSLPYYVWIGKDGTVKALTGDKEVTEVNIRKLLQENSIALPVMRSFQDFATHAPFNEHEAFQENMLQSTHLTGQIVGLPGTQGIHKYSERLRRVFALNNTIKGLYIFAYKLDMRSQPVDYDRLFRMQLRDSARFFTKGNGLFVPNHYCFEQIMEVDTGKVDNAVIFRKLQRELDHQFGLKSEIRTITTDCYIVTKGQNFSPSRSAKKVLDIGETSVRLRLQGAETVVAYIKTQFPSPVPMVIEGFTAGDRIDLDLKKYPDMDSLRKDLNKAGMDIRLEPRAVRMVFVAD